MEKAMAKFKSFMSPAKLVFLVSFMSGVGIACWLVEKSKGDSDS